MAVQHQAYTLCICHAFHVAALGIMYDAACAVHFLRRQSWWWQACSCASTMSSQLLLCQILLPLPRASYPGSMPRLEPRWELVPSIKLHLLVSLSVCHVTHWKLCYRSCRRPLHPEHHQFKGTVMPSMLLAFWLGASYRRQGDKSLIDSSRCLCPACTARSCLCSCISTCPALHGGRAIMCMSS